MKATLNRPSDALTYISKVAVVLLLALTASSLACGNDALPDTTAPFDERPSVDTTSTPANGGDGTKTAQPNEEPPSSLQSTRQIPKPGDRVLITGNVLDENGSPIKDVTVEIWQADARGIYNHPRDPNTERRERSFQFYGEDVTDGGGRFRFITIVPGQEFLNRPSHLHFKARINGRESLTTQLYFQDEDPTSSGLRGVPNILILNFAEDTIGDDQFIWSAHKTIVLDVGIHQSLLDEMGTLEFTPEQIEGPYYPVDKPEDSDNDLTAVEQIR